MSRVVRGGLVAPSSAGFPSFLVKMHGKKAFFYRKSQKKEGKSQKKEGKLQKKEGKSQKKEGKTGPSSDWRGTGLSILCIL